MMRIVGTVMTVLTLVAVLAVQGRAQIIAYVLPDVGTPGMNTYVEIIGPQINKFNYGPDTLYKNNPGDFIRVVCANAADTSKITIGPIVVSWEGRTIAAQIFVNPDIQPNSSDWTALNSGFVVPICVQVSGILSNPVNFYIIRPLNALSLSGNNVFGSGGLMGRRSPRGGLIVDSLNLGAGEYTFDTLDLDANVANGNPRYLPVTLISKGPIRMNGAAVLNVNAQGKHGGPGGGGGGGQFCDVNGGGVDGGKGFTGGGPGGQNRSGIPTSTDGFKAPGVGTGPSVNNTGSSLTGVLGGTAPWYEASGGGTGHPFGTSGEGCSSGSGCAPPGGYGGGSGQQQQQAGGSGGYTTPGSSSRGSNGGLAHGNAMLVPLAGGSGGASGNPQGFGTCSGDGGGGGGALRVYGSVIRGGYFSANGGNGQSRAVGSGGSGSGGGLVLEAKLLSDPLSIRTSGGIEGGRQGGAGRIRYDGPFVLTAAVIEPSEASRYRGLSTDTSQFVPRDFILTGTGNGEPINIYLKSASTPWTFIARIENYANNSWTYPVTLDAPDTIFYLAALQELPVTTTNEYERQPSRMLSQAAANVLIFRRFPVIVASQSRLLPTLFCDSTALDTLIVGNTGLNDLRIESADFIGASGAFDIIRGQFPLIIPPGGVDTIIVRFRAPGDPGIIRDTLMLVNNDTSDARNPFYVTFIADRQPPALSFTEHRIDAGDLTCVGGSAEVTVMARNDGATSLSMPAPGFSNPSLVLIDPPPSAFPLLIPSGGSVPLRVRILPTRLGKDSGAVVIEATIEGCTLLDSAVIVWNRDSISIAGETAFAFPAVLCGEAPAERDVFIVNNGNVPIILENPTLPGAPFSIVSPSFAFPVVVQPNDSVQVRIRFAPLQEGSYADRLRLDVQPCGRVWTIDFSGERIRTELVGASVDFGLVPAGSFPVQRNVVVRNVGASTVSVGAILSPSGSPFSVTSGIPVTLQPGDTALLTVQFNNPGSDGLFTDTLTLLYQPPCDDVFILALGGRGTAQVTLEAGRISAAPGERIDIPVYLRNAVNLSLFGATGITTTLRFNPMLLYPLTQDRGVRVNGMQEMTLALGLTPGPDDVIARIPCMVMLGNAEGSVLELKNSAGIGGSIQITEVSGEFLLDNLCRDGGTRLFDGTLTGGIANNAPNPFNAETVISFTVNEEGWTTISVVNSLGERVAVLQDGWVQPGAYRLSFNAGEMPGGVYHCVMQTPTRVYTRRMIVAK